MIHAKTILNPLAGIVLAIAYSAHAAGAQGAAGTVAEEPDAVTWIAGENFSLPVPADSATTTLDLEYSKTANGWKKAKTRIPAIVADARHPVRADLKQTGEYHYRLVDPRNNRVKRAFRVKVLPPAGSPETGPFLKAFPAWDRELLSENQGQARVGRAKSFRQAVFRLAKAQGGAQCLPGYESFYAKASDTMEAYAFTKSALPVLVSRIKYHYMRSADAGVTPGEYHRCSFPKDTCATNFVTLLARDAFFFTNGPDKIAEIKVGQGSNSVTLVPGGEAEFRFRGTGRQNVEISVTYMSGLTRKNTVEIFVKSELTPGQIEAQKAMLAQNLQAVETPVPFIGK
jgi:hypothetical protein